MTSSASPGAFLGGIPTSLRDELTDALNEISRNFRENRWGPSELKGGMLCEVVYAIVKGEADGSFPARAYKPGNMVDACKNLEQERQLPRALRIQIPRMMVALYEIRNNRGVGHVGGEVDPSHMDAVAVLYMAKWLVCELVRYFHSVDTSTATEVVDALIERELPSVWKVADKKRALSSRASLKDKTLLLLYSEPGSVAEDEIRTWVEASRAADYRRDVLKKCHRDKLLEYDEQVKTVRLSPLGARYVEQNIPLEI